MNSSCVRGRLHQVSFLFTSQKKPVRAEAGRVRLGCFNWIKVCQKLQRWQCLASELAIFLSSNDYCTFLFVWCT